MKQTQNVFSKQCQAIIQEPRGLKRPREVCAGGRVVGMGVGSEEFPGVLVASLQLLPTKGEGAALEQLVGLLLPPPHSSQTVWPQAEKDG